MSRGEILFYLREIRDHWSTSNVSLDKLLELERAQLIQINQGPVPAVRLTTEGARLKKSGRPREVGSRVSFNGKRAGAKERSRRVPSRNMIPPRPLV